MSSMQLALIRQLVRPRASSSMSSSRSASSRKALSPSAGAKLRRRRWDHEPQDKVRSVVTVHDSSSGSTSQVHRQGQNKTKPTNKYGAVMQST